MMMMITMRTIGMMMMTMTMGAQSGARLPSDGRAGKKLPPRLKSSPSLLINIMRMTKMVTENELTNTILNLPKLQVGSCPGQTCQNSQPVAGSNLSTTYGCLFSSKSATDRQIGPENQQPTVNTQHLSWQNRRPPRSPHNITELQRVIININFHPPFQLHQLAALDMLFQPVLEIHKHFSAASTKKAPIVPMLGSLALVSRFSNVS